MAISSKRLQWMFEKRRVLLATAFALVAAVICVALSASSSLFSTLDAVVVVVLVYLTTHMVITVVVFQTASEDEISAWGDREERGTLFERYVLGTAPGPGASIFVAAVAMFATMVWLPGAGPTAMPVQLRLGIGGVLLVVAWLEVVLSFTITFRADDALEGGKAFDFPGTEKPVASDYVYFALSVMVTFGTTDVNVTSSAMRKTVAVNAAIGFVFNTVIVAAAVSLLTSTAAGS